jgi:hypothetical protein
MGKGGKTHEITLFLKVPPLQGLYMDQSRQAQYRAMLKAHRGIANFGGAAKLG